MSDLPVNIDSTYPDDGDDPSVKAHQQHHDALHALHNDYEGTSPADFATAAQGSLADTAVQPADLTPYAQDDEVVHDTGNETVAGVKTFSSSPIVPTPTTDMQAATKKYVDDNTGSMSAADILTAIKTVDGAGSGLDADLLDGLSSAAFAEADGEYAVNTVAASGATETLTLAPAHDVTMDESCTFTFPTPTAGHTFLLRLSGAFTPTFPASVDWDSATAPTYATPSLYGFTTLDGGTTWIGTLIASGLA